MLSLRSFVFIVAVFRFSLGISQQFSRCPSLTHIRCFDGMTCIRKSWMCDGKVDCPDHSDELAHVCLKRSSQNKLQLQEIHPGLKCPSSWFRCYDSSSCISPNRVCDKYKDCRDGSDERENCNQTLRTPNTTVIY